MRIAFLIPAIDAMGPNIFIQNLISGLAPYKDVECEVFHFDRGSKDIRQLVFPVKVTKLDFSIAYDFSGFDILHSNMPIPDLYVVKHKLYKKYTCITTMHCFYETDLVQRKGWLKGLLEKNIWKYALNKIHNVIVSSTNMKEYYEHELSSNHVYDIIPYGIPILERYDLDPLIEAQIASLKNKYKLVCSCGTLIKRKGFHQLVKYLVHNDSAAVILFGRGVLEGELRQMAQELGVQNRLLFLGYMNAPYRYYHLMDAFAMCSNSEGFGLALLEAMQLGTPIICTNLPIYNDYFNENEVGLFEFDDQDSFNKAVDKVLMQNEYYKEQSLVLSKNVFSLENMSRMHYDYYNKLLEKNNAVKRFLSVDIAKGMSIIAIVFGHIAYQYPFCQLVNTKDLFINLWHVAVFFLLAGFFIKDDQLVQPKLWFKKKFSSLYLKILYFYVPAVLLHNVLIKIGWYSLESTDPVIKTYSMIDFAKQTVLAICLGGREPIVGAMWFVYVLFMALIGLSVVSWAIKKLAKDERQYEWMRGIALLAMCIVAGILSNKYGLTIRRFSNTFTAMLLIYVGKIMYQKMKLSFDNGYLAIICGLIAFEVACMLGGVALNGNEYKDILQLLVAAPAVLYIIMYIGKHIEANVVGKAIAYVGKDSFYVMALHFVGFKFCTLALHGIGMGGANLSDLTPTVGSNVLLLLIYAFFGVGFPLLFMWGFRRGKTIIQKIF